MEWKELITEYLLDITIKGFSERTIASYSHKLGRLAKFFISEGMVNPLNLHKKDVKMVILFMKNKGNAHSTINNSIAILKKLYDYAEEEGYIGDNPVRVKNLKEKKNIIYPLNDAEIKQMLTAARSHPYPLQKARNPVIFMLMVDCGLRIGEIEKLNESDILQNQVRILNAKGNKDRAVALSPVVKKELIKYLRVKKRLKLQNEALFVTYHDTRMNRSNVIQIMDKISKVITVRPEVRFSPHTLRHTYAAMQLRNGLDIFTLSLNMGHQNIAITQDYIKSLRSEDFLDKSVRTSTLMNLK